MTKQCHMYLFLFCLSVYQTRATDGWHFSMQQNLPKCIFSRHIFDAFGRALYPQVHYSQSVALVTAELKPVKQCDFRNDSVLWILYFSSLFASVVLTLFAWVDVGANVWGSALGFRSVFVRFSLVPAPLYKLVKRIPGAERPYWLFYLACIPTALCPLFSRSQSIPLCVRLCPLTNHSGQMLFCTAVSQTQSMTSSYTH